MAAKSSVLQLLHVNTEQFVCVDYWIFFCLLMLWVYL